jgi:hypothetical protein
MGGAYSTHVREEECIQVFGKEAGRKDHQEDFDVGGRIVLKWTLGK